MKTDDIGERWANAMRTLHGLVEDLYADRMRRELQDVIRQACRMGDVPPPEAVDLVWEFFGTGIDNSRWRKQCRHLGVAPDAQMQFCHFIYEVRWPQDAGRPPVLPPLLFVGEVALEVDDRVLALAAGHRQDLDAGTRDGYVLVVGDRFSEELAARDGGGAVASSGAHFLHRPKDRDDVPFLSDISTVTALMQDWAAQHADDGHTETCSDQAQDGVPGASGRATAPMINPSTRKQGLALRLTVGHSGRSPDCGCFHRIGRRCASLPGRFAGSRGLGVGDVRPICRGSRRGRRPERQARTGPIRPGRPRQRSTETP